MPASTPQAPPRASHLAGYLLALAAGATWGTTGPLSTGLYRLMPATSIGFWRVLLGTVCLALWGLLFRRALFRVDPRGVAGLTAGAVLAANFLFFAAVQRIEAAPAAVAATIEPVVGTLLALLLFNQRLSGLGWLGLALVVGGVAVGYLQEAKGEDH